MCYIVGCGFSLAFLNFSTVNTFYGACTIIETVDICFSTESKQYLDQAMQRGYILASIIKCILTGCAGVGKTHLLCLLLGVKPPMVRCSTPCAKTPLRVVSGTRIQRVDGGWVEVGVEDLQEMLASYVPIL